MYPSVPSMHTGDLLSPSCQYDDQQPVVLRRRSSSELARQKFGTMPLLPIRGDDSGATLLSANQTLVRPHGLLQPPPDPLCFPLPCYRRECCTCQPTASARGIPPLHPHRLLQDLTVSLCLSLPSSPSHLFLAAIAQPEDPVHVLCEYCACSSYEPVSSVPGAALCPDAVLQPVYVCVCGGWEGRKKKNDMW